MVEGMDRAVVSSNKDFVFTVAIEIGDYESLGTSSDPVVPCPGILPCANAGIEQFRELGVGRAMVPAFFFAGPGGMERLAEFGELVVKPASATEAT